MKWTVFLFVATSAVHSLVAQQERITDFTSDVDVRASGDLFVTETLSVVAEGGHIKRGIYRDFPTLYKSAGGLKRRVDFEVLGVTRDGTPEPWKTENRDNGVRVYIGRADFLVPPGPHTYVLRYRTNRQLFPGESFDALYWNVTGNGWAFPIDHALARVQLPPGAHVRSEEAYTGRQGGKGQDWRVAAIPGVDAALETTRPLPPGSGFTISVTWPKGFLDASANPTGLAAAIGDNPAIAVAAGGLLVVLAYYVAIWFFLGRDPRRGVIIPLYHPPKGFTPAAVRYLAGMGRFDNKSFAAALIALAVAGKLRIVQSGKKHFQILRTNAAGGVVTAAQQKFFDTLLGTRKSLDFTNSHHAIFSEARAGLLRSLSAEIEKRYFIRNAGFWLAGLLLSLIPAGLALWGSSDMGAAVFMLFWLSIWSVGVIALLSGVVSAFRGKSAWTAIPMLLFSIPFVIGWFVGAGFLIHATSVWTAGIFGVAFLLNLVFHHLLKAPTREGRRVMDAIEGFKHYLSVAEAERLNLQNPPDRTPEEFERFLPYALALDVEQQWAEQFASVLDQTNYSPDWYHGPGGSFYPPASMAVGLGGAMASAISSASTAPGSSSGSGSGGSGSSGGGGGGGGGGGW